MGAGAVISGGVLGDELSPLSDTTNLAPLVVEVNLYEHIRHMLWTTVPASIVGLIVWFFVGINTDYSSASAGNVEGLLAELDMIYNWNVFMLIPFAIILWGALWKKPVVPMMLLSSVAPAFLGMFAIGFTLVDGLTSMPDGFSVAMLHVLGFDPDSLSDNVTTLILRG